jgi:large subunit ribosomal protein L37Ae
MAAKIKVGSVKRFGVRYGTKVRNKLGIVENISKKMHKCPYCSSLNVKKVSNGIFLCSKCASKFTGKAYAPIKKVSPVELEQAKPEDFQKESEEDENYEEEDTAQDEEQTDENQQDDTEDESRKTRQDETD